MKKFTFLIMIVIVLVIAACGKNEEVKNVSADLPATEEEARTLYVVQTSNDIRAMKSAVNQLNSLIYNSADDEKEIEKMGLEIMQLTVLTNDHSDNIDSSDHINFQGTIYKTAEIKLIVEEMYTDYSNSSLKYDEENVKNIKINLLKVEKMLPILEEQFNVDKNKQ